MCCSYIFFRSPLPYRSPRNHKQWNISYKLISLTIENRKIQDFSIQFNSLHLHTSVITKITLYNIFVLTYLLYLIIARIVLYILYRLYTLPFINSGTLMMGTFMIFHRSHKISVKKNRKEVFKNLNLFKEKAVNLFCNYVSIFSS